LSEKSFSRKRENSILKFAEKISAVGSEKPPGVLQAKSATYSKIKGKIKIIMGQSAALNN